MKAYVIRWRGRSEGPLPLEEIDSRLNAGQLGLLTEIQVDGQWMTLRDFYHAQAAGDRPSQGQPPVAEEKAAAAPQSQIESLSDEPTPREPLGGTKSKRLIFAATAILVVCMLGCLALASRFFPRTTTHKEPAGSAKTEPATNQTSAAASSAQVPNGTNTSIAAAASNSAFAPPITNAATGTPTEATNSATTSSNIAQIIQPPLLPPLPEDEPRTFHLKNGTNYVGVIVSADRNGLIIKLGTSEYTPRLAWNLFDEEALAREPKVIAFKKAQQAAREAAERVRIAAAEAAEKARIEKAEAERRLAEYHAKQDALIEASIREFGWKSVTRGYLQAWGGEVTIGEIFAVVAPSASWSAGKLASYEPERYTHYLVEAKWTNDKGQPVAMQYLVTADGSDFHLHGCFVSGSKMADLPFLLAVKDIWNRQK